MILSKALSAFQVSNIFFVGVKNVLFIKCVEKIDIKGDDDYNDASKLFLCKFYIFFLQSFLLTQHSYQNYYFL